jgi:hypothetical protein
MEFHPVGTNNKKKVLLTVLRYCPGSTVPRCPQECKNMNLDPYRHTELVVFLPNKVKKFPLDL